MISEIWELLLNPIFDSKVLITSTELKTEQIYSWMKSLQLMIYDFFAPVSNVIFSLLDLVKWTLNYEFIVFEFNLCKFSFF